MTCAVMHGCGAPWQINRTPQNRQQSAETLASGNRFMPNGLVFWDNTCDILQKAIAVSVQLRTDSWHDGFIFQGRPMALFVRFLMCVVVLGVAGLFVLKAPDGNTWLSLDDITDPMESSLANIGNKVQQGYAQIKGDMQETGITSAANSAKSTFYKWRDEQGVWQYSDTPPADVKKAEILSIDPKTNLISSYNSGGDASKAPRDSTQDNLPGGVSLKNMADLTDAARNARALQEQRAEDMKDLSY